MFKRSIFQVLGASFLIAFASSASALIILDGWQLDTTAADSSAVSDANGSSDDTVGDTLSTGIGHLNMSGGEATVIQELAFDGTEFTPFSGAKFSEFGGIFSVNYTPESSPGASDSGFPISLAGGLGLEFRFSGLTGTVTSYDTVTGEVNYAFDTGVGLVSLYGTQDSFATEDWLASFSLVAPSGGDLGSFQGAAGTAGDSTITSLVASSVSDLFRDSAGLSLNDRISSGELLGIVVTTNQISSPFAGPVACGFAVGAGNICSSGSIQSVGTFDLARVPEPGSLLLMALGLLLLGEMKRRSIMFT